MKNKYENNLRTHYAPLKRSKHYFPKTNDDCNNKSQNFYKKELKLFQSPCYNKTIQLRYKTPNNYVYKESRNKEFMNLDYKKNTDLNLLKKEKLNKSFNTIHPFYFQDKIQLMKKEKIEKKVKDRMHIQREALKQLSLYKIKNPSKKEVLQKINELSINPLLAHEPKPPLYLKTIENYYYNDNIIKKNDINIFNRPRKEIDEYYNKCQYQIPTTYDSDTIIHTKSKYIFPRLEKIKFENQIKEEIMKQRNKKYKKEERKYEDVKNGKLKNKIYNEFDTFVKRKEKYQKLSKEKEIILDNNLLTEYNQYVKSHLNDGKKVAYNNIRMKMEKEDLQEDLKKEQEKNRARKILNDWDNIYKKAKDKRNNEKIKEKKMWRNYSETFEINYNPKIKLSKKYRFNKNYSKGNFQRIIDDNYK